MMHSSYISRRAFGIQAGAAALAGSSAMATLHQPFSLNYILASPMYGTAPLAEVLGEVHKVGATAIDIWPQVHANHREQMEQLGFDRVQELLDEYQVRIGMITRYDLGPYRLTEEIPTLKRFQGKLLVSGARHRGGDTVKEQVRRFLETLRPHVERAEEHGITIGIENHSKTILSTVDSVLYFAELARSPHLGLAMAPYHLPQDPERIARLIRSLGPENLAFFQAWQHGMGCHEKLPKSKELLQMPGRGPLDFRPIVRALSEIGYSGWTEIFMHPVPRGIAILESTAKVTQEINRARRYLNNCLLD